MVDVYDPYANKEQVKTEYHIEMLDTLPTYLQANDRYQAVILAVAHKPFLTMDFGSLKNADTIIFDTKAALDRSIVDARL
jgi:UDP-N-acetyl-D-galactosamine dehydrogenase